jgi:hypothetical protein
MEMTSQRIQHGDQCSRIIDEHIRNRRHNVPLRSDGGAHFRVELLTGHSACPISSLPRRRWFGEIPCSIDRGLVDLDHFEVIGA